MQRDPPKTFLKTLSLFSQSEFPEKGGFTKIGLVT